MPVRTNARHEAHAVLEISDAHLLNLLLAPHELLILMPHPLALGLCILLLDPHGSPGHLGDRGVRGSVGIDLSLESLVASSIASDDIGELLAEFFGTRSRKYHDELYSIFKAHELGLGTTTTRQLPLDDLTGIKNTVGDPSD